MTADTPTVKIIIIIHKHNIIQESLHQFLIIGEYWALEYGSMYIDDETID